MQRLKNIFHLFEAILANIRYGFPARKLAVIGVTGTDGKTTTTSLIYHILKESGISAAMVSTVGAYIGDSVSPVGFHVTTPSPFALQNYIRRAVEAGCTHLVLEVTSHALDQNRAWGIPFKIGVLTNVTHEHLDYHRTYDRYLRTKLKLLERAEAAILNMDDSSYSPAMKLFEGAEVLTYSKKNDKATVTPKKFPFKTNLVGEYNRENCLAAITVCRKLHVSDAKIRRALLSFKPPAGRLAVVYDKEFKIIIDFAHTPNAFKVVLPEVAKLKKGRLIHVFGSAGFRDHTKRPMMGELSSKYADIIVLTAEDPRTEKTEDICRQISAGFVKHFRLAGIGETGQKNVYYIIPNRHEAVEYAITVLVQKGDMLLFTGKAHEKSMNYGFGEEPWDEFEEVKKALSQC